MCTGHVEISCLENDDRAVDMDLNDTISTRGKLFHCDLCDVKIASESAVQDHLQGKKHQRLSAIRISRQKQAECSIFVGGLTKLVSELELSDYFSKFGSVSQVIVDKDKGKYAIVEFSENDSAEKAAEVEKQKMNGKKITVRPRECKPVTLKGKQHVSVGKQAKSARDRELDALLEKLVDEENVCFQISTLMGETSLDQSDLQLRYLICDLLKEVFVEVFPKCRVFPYGSSVSGFGVKGCDLDLQVDLGRDPEQFRYQFASLPSGAGEAEDVDDMETNDEDVPSSEMSETQPDTSSMSSEEILQLLCRLLKQCVPSCSHVRVIPSSRRPVIKFIHKESGLHCDLSLDNRLALRNTELLHFYSQLDDRVKPLIFAIRLWAKQHQLAGNPQGPGPRLTNYALTLLVLHYLQNTQTPVLPAFSQLKDLASASNEEVIEGWNCTFTTDGSKLHGTENTENVESLMKGFFSFYTKCDFATTVLCTSCAKATPLTTFLQESQETTSPESTSREFKVGSVNIQDPFELTHNVAANVNDKVAAKLRGELRKADLMCISLRYRKPECNPETGKVARWGLLTLLEDRDSGSGKGQKEQHPSIVIPLRMSQISPEFIQKFQDEQEMKLAWCQQVEDFVQRLIDNVLRVECQVEAPASDVEGPGECSMETTPSKEQVGGSDSPPKQERTDSGTSQKETMARCDDEGGGGGEVAASDSGILRDAHLHGDDDDDDDDDKEAFDEPASKRQKLDSSMDVSMTSSGNTSLTSSDDLKSPLSSATKSPLSILSPNMGKKETKTTRVLICKTSHAVWVGRRKLRKKLNMEKPWGDASIDELSREKYISEELIKSTPSGSQDVTEFKLEFQRKLVSDFTAVALTFHTIKNEANVFNFKHFLEEFVVKMLNISKV